MFKHTILKALMAGVMAIFTIGSNGAFSTISPKQMSLPPWIAGYKVIGIYTPADISCMPERKVQLVLQTSDLSLKNHLQDNRVQDVMSYVRQNNIAGNAKVSLTLVGPDITADEVLQGYKQWNDLVKTMGCIKLDPLPPGTPGDWVEVKATPPTPGYAVVQDLDPAIYPDITGQSVIFTAPVIGSKMDYAETLFELDNAMTNADYFLQSGIGEFQSSGCKNCPGGLVLYTSTGYATFGQPFPITYVAGHQYQSMIYLNRNNTPYVWELCAADYTLTPGSYTCVFDFSSAGSAIQQDPNTDIFAENHNYKNSRWYYGFTNPVNAYNAQYYEYSTSTWYPWSNQARFTIDSTQANWPAANAISGSIINGNTIYFNLPGIPMGVYPY